MAKVIIFLDRLVNYYLYFVVMACFLSLVPNINPDYPLFDFILCKFITHSDFIYSIHSHIIQPILFALIFGTTFWAVDNNRKDK